MSLMVRTISTVLALSLALQTLALGVHASSHSSDESGPSTCVHSCGGSHHQSPDDAPSTPGDDDGDTCGICLLALQGFKSGTISIEVPSIVPVASHRTSSEVPDRVESRRPTTIAHPRAPPVRIG